MKAKEALAQAQAGSIADLKRAGVAALMHGHASPADGQAGTAGLPDRPACRRWSVLAAHHGRAGALPGW